MRNFEEYVGYSLLKFLCDKEDNEVCSIRTKVRDKCCILAYGDVYQLYSTLGLYILDSMIIECKLDSDLNTWVIKINMDKEGWFETDE